MPVPFLLTGMAAFYGWAEEPARRVLRQSAVVIATLAFVIILPRHTPALAGLFSANPELAGQGSAAGGAADCGADRRFGPARGRHGACRDTGPGLCAGGRAGIYPELATGSFLLRVGDLLTPEERTRYVDNVSIGAARPAGRRAARGHPGRRGGRRGDSPTGVCGAHGYREVGQVDGLRLFVR